MTGIEIPVDRVGAFVGPPALMASGPPDGVLAGVRVAVKDVFDVAGQVTGAGNPTFAGGRPAAGTHAVAVQRLIDAGASIVGKSVLDELAYSLAGSNIHHGTPVNSAAPGHLAGGSSSGSAAAVAAGAVELGLATDTGGSIRVPASYCGLFGWRPTHGAVDVTGVVPLAPSFDTVGLLAREPHVLQLGADALMGIDRGTPLPLGSLGPIRIWGEALDAVPAAIQAVVAEASVGGRTGWSPPGRVDLGLDLRAAAEAFRVLQAREAWIAHGGWIAAAEPQFAPDIAARFAAASEVTDDEVIAAQVVRDHVRRILDGALGGGMVLVLAAAGSPPPAVDADPAALALARMQAMSLTATAGLAGLPVAVAPGGLVDGLPLGAAFIGAAGSDRMLLHLLAGVTAGS